MEENDQVSGVFFFRFTLFFSVFLLLRLILLGKRVFAGAAHSLYAFSIFNPFNFIPLRFLSRLFGVSDSFWNKVVVPLYSSTFLTSNLNYIPSVVKESCCFPVFFFFFNKKEIVSDYSIDGRDCSS